MADDDGLEEALPTTDEQVMFEESGQTLVPDEPEG
jgi:hypothetical protein